MTFLMGLSLSSADGASTHETASETRQWTSGAATKGSLSRSLSRQALDYPFIERFDCSLHDAAGRKAKPRVMVTCKWLFGWDSFGTLLGHVISNRAGTKPKCQCKRYSDRSSQCASEPFPGDQHYREQNHPQHHGRGRDGYNCMVETDVRSHPVPRGFTSEYHPSRNDWPQ